MSNREVADRLGISSRTIEIHRARVMEKTGAQSLSGLVRMVCSCSEQLVRPELQPDGELVRADALTQPLRRRGTE
jgi:hypothetical protein